MKDPDVKSLIAYLGIFFVGCIAGKLVGVYFDPRKIELIHLAAMGGIFVNVAAAIQLVRWVERMKKISDSYVCRRWL